MVNGEIYHIVLRGVDGRLIFEDNADYYRAIHDLFEFNDESPADWSYRRFHSFSKNSVRENNSETQFENSSRAIKKRKLLLKILAFCLMPNHIHLLFQQLRSQGITKFMRKFGAGYGGYFNRKYTRQGHLFQGRFRAVLIKTNDQLKNVFVYIHTNPVSLIEPEWKNGKIKSPSRAIEMVEQYKWSSYKDYLGERNFPSITQRELYIDIMPKEEWRILTNEWIRGKWIDFNDVVLE